MVYIPASQLVQTYEVILETLGQYYINILLAEWKLMFELNCSFWGPTALQLTFWCRYIFKTPISRSDNRSNWKMDTLCTLSGDSIMNWTSKWVIEQRVCPMLWATWVRLNPNVPEVNGITPHGYFCHKMRENKFRTFRQEHELNEGKVVAYHISVITLLWEQ